MADRRARLEEEAATPGPEEAASPERADIAVVAKGGAVQVAGQVSQRSLSFVFSAIAVRILEASGYGLYRQVAQVLAVAGQLGLAGFNYASMRFIARARALGEPGEVRGAARVGLLGAAIASAAVLIALLVAADPLASAFKGPDEGRAELASLIRLGAAYVPLFAFMQVLRYCTQAYKTMVPSVVVGNIIQPAVRFVAGLLALLAGFAVAGAVTTLTLSMAVGAIAGAFYFRRILTADERASAPRLRTGEMVRFALPQAGSSLLGIQSLGLGILVLGVLSDDRAVGLFAVALALQGPASVFLGGLVNVWAPVVSDLHGRGDIDRLDSLYKTLTRWIATFSFPVLAALILEPDVFVNLFAGDEARGAAGVVAVLAAGNFFYTGTGPTGYVISMTGRPGVNFANSIAAVALYVIGGMLFVPRYGVLGMAAVDAVVTALVNVARVIEAKVLVGVQPFGRPFLKPLAATLAGAVVLLLWRLVPGPLIVDVAGIVVAAAVYLSALAALGMDAEERYVWERIRARMFRRRSGNQPPS